MSRVHQIQKLRREMDLLDPPLPPEAAGWLDHAALLEEERERHHREMRELREELTGMIDRVRLDAERTVREEGSRMRALLEKERSRADRLQAEVERLTRSLRSSRQEAAGHRMLRRELEVRVKASEEARDAALARVEELVAIARELARGRDGAAPDRVISLEDRAGLRPSS